jgi:hypothetical protein
MTRMFGGVIPRPAPGALLRAVCPGRSGDDRGIDGWGQVEFTVAVGMRAREHKKARAGGYNTWD